MAALKSKGFLHLSGVTGKAAEKLETAGLTPSVATVLQGE
jgi:hypothetical protein